jgi:hypothetical protein
MTNIDPFAPFSDGKKTQRPSLSRELLGGLLGAAVMLVIVIVLVNAFVGPGRPTPYGSCVKWYEHMMKYGESYPGEIDQASEECRP